MDATTCTPTARDLINRLPLEILQEIMLWVREAAMPVTEIVSYNWVAVAQVCRRWREAALGCSALWSTLIIPPASFWWFEELCRRSRSSRTRVEVSSGLPVRDDVTPFGQRHLRSPFDRLLGLPSLLKQQLHRIRVLTLNLTSNDAMVLLQGLNTPAPSLEQLEITSSELELPQSLFDCSLPNLRRLYLNQCDFDWDTLFSSPMLQELSITEPAAYPQPGQIFQLLSSFPFLQLLELRLALSDVGHINWDGLTIGQGSLQLPHLRTLILHDERDIVIDFLSHIRLHDTLVLNLHSWDPIHIRLDNRFAEKVAFPLIAGKISRCEEFNIRMLSIIPGNRAEFAFFSPSDEEPLLEFTVSGNNRGHQGESLDDKFHGYCKVVEQLPLNKLRCCAITGTIPLQPSTFTSLSHSPNLTTLTFGRCWHGSDVRFIGNLVNRIPQCLAHKQDQSCSSNFRLESTIPEQESECFALIIEWDDYDGTSEDSVVIGGDGERVRMDGDQKHFPFLRKGEPLQPSARETKRNHVWVSEYEVEQCDDCERLAIETPFFPALRKLDFLGINVEQCWVGSELEQRLHPVADFLVRRIRCGLRIEEIAFNLALRDWEYFHVRGRLPMEDDLRALCGDLGPLITVKQNHPNPRAWYL